MGAAAQASGSAHKLADRLKAKLPGTRVLSGGAVGAAAPAVAPASITAGGNLAAALSTGDATAAAVGTATMVCNGTVVGFGHPLRLAGRSSYSMHPASAVYVQEDPPLTPFKGRELRRRGRQGPTVPGCPGSAGASAPDRTPLESAAP